MREPTGRWCVYDGDPSFCRPTVVADRPASGYAEPETRFTGRYEERVFWATSSVAQMTRTERAAVKRWKKELRQ